MIAKKRVLSAKSKVGKVSYEGLKQEAIVNLGQPVRPARVRSAFKMLQTQNNDIVDNLDFETVKKNNWYLAMSDDKAITEEVDSVGKLQAGSIFMNTSSDHSNEKKHRKMNSATSANMRDLGYKTLQLNADDLRMKMATLGTDPALRIAETDREALGEDRCSDTEEPTGRKIKIRKIKLPGLKKNKTLRKLIKNL